MFSHRITCSTIEASLPRAKPHSSPRVTTALPSFTTIRFACFSSLRCANDFPCARLSGMVINGMLLQQRMDSFRNLWLRQGTPADKEKKEKKAVLSVSFRLLTLHNIHFSVTVNEKLAFKSPKQTEKQEYLSSTNHT